MGRRLIFAGMTSAVGIAINFATDNAQNPVAWIAVVALTVLIAVLSPTSGAGQRIFVRGKDNVVRQRGAVEKNAVLSGDNNQIDQED